MANGELKQQRRRWLRKRPLKSEFALLQTLSRLFHLVKCWQMFLELNFGGEFGHFHVVVVQRRAKKCLLLIKPIAF